MRRRLQNRDTTFRSLLNEVRREFVETLILDQHLTLTEISFMLGFSEASSFTRAFRNWYGLSPTEARKAALEG